MVDAALAETGRPAAARFLSKDTIPLVYASLAVLDPIIVFGFGMFAFVAYDGANGLGLAHDQGLWASDYARNSIIGAILAPVVFYALGCYRAGAFASRWRAVKSSIKAVTLLFVLLLVMGFVAKEILDVSRGWALLWFGTLVVGLAGTRYGAVSLIERGAESGLMREVVAVVGSTANGYLLVQQILRDTPASVEIVGVFDDRLTDGRGPARDHDNRLSEQFRTDDIWPNDRAARLMAPLGTIDDLIELGKRRAIDRVIVTLPWSAEHRLLDIFKRLKAIAVDIELCPDSIGLNLLRRPIRDVAGLPMLRMVDRPLASWQNFGKSIEDKVIAALALLVVAPTMAIIALGIRLDSPGPVLFKQRRHGFNNREIEVFKFRTMYVEAADPTGARQTQRGDRRITRFGSILRRLSLDELPQVFNVLRGDMSIVGPRPHPIGMRTGDMLCHEIITEYAHRHRMKPGITGWAQVNGYRGATETPEQLRGRIEHDLYYIENWSIRFDIRIILLTFVRLLSKNAF